MVLVVGFCFSVEHAADTRTQASNKDTKEANTEDRLQSKHQATRAELLRSKESVNGKRANQMRSTRAVS
eukprot:4151474-Amphidinium_carterae.1